jgi:hypothetical protein
MAALMYGAAPLAPTEQSVAIQNRYSSSRHSLDPDVVFMTVSQVLFIQHIARFPH